MKNALISHASRRGFLGTLSAIAATQVLPASAQEAYPSRSIQLIIPNAPGSSVDTMGRAVGARMAPLLQQSMVMDNRAGAAGAIGVEAGRRAAPDGYILIVGSTSAITTAPLLQKAVPYDPLRDLDLLAIFAMLPNVLVVNPALPVQTTAELIAYARSKGDKTNMASAGPGSASHLAGVAFQNAAGFKSLHVPYKGGSQGVASVVAGETDWVLTPAPAAMSLVKSGRLRLLGHSMGTQHKPVGDTPSLAATVPGYEFAGWIGLLAPKGLPPAVTRKLLEVTEQAIKQPELQAAFETNGAVPTFLNPQAFQTFLVKDIELNRKAIETAGLKPE
jgi:tripartite-type tricarboxylate transporter receptor subunit TctC